MIGRIDHRVLLLLPMELEGHWRGSINQPGDIVPDTGGDYGKSTVMMEDAEDSEQSGTPNYTINANNGSVDQSADYDLVKIVLYWPKGVKANGTLQLTATGIQVDGSQQPASSSSVGNGVNS